jgi:P27 family predicted phage terminase small subunit
MAGIVGRPPKPTALKVITGHQKGDTGGKKVSGARAGEPPAHLNEYAKQEWARVAPILEKRGLISEEEAAALALYCQAYGRWQQAELKITELAGTGDGLIVKAPSGYPIQNPYLAIANKAMEQCYQYLQQFGLSPSARARISGVQLGLFDNSDQGKKESYFN